MYDTSVNENQANQVSSKTQPVCTGINLIGSFIGVIMKKIPLSQGQFALVDDKDVDRLKSYNWYALRVPHGFYVICNIKKDKKTTTMSMHRFLLNAPDGVDVDHKDHNGLNNQRANIRLCTRSQNMMNQRCGQKNEASIFKGVCASNRGKPWRAKLRIGRNHVSLGNYATEEEAAMAYDEGAQELFGEFACLNFPRTAEDKAKKKG